MKKLGIGCLSLLGILFVLAIIGFMVANKPLPEGTEGPEADALAQQMMEKLNKPAWDSLNYVSWTFADRQHYIWDKQANDAVISWGENKVIMDLDEVTGTAYTSGNVVTDATQKQTLISTAWSHWCNDSFWLYAPFKVFDKGTKRSIVETDEANKALLISYEGGGVTPGDSYLWLLDNSAMPQAYRMWVDIIPIGGVSVDWKDWKILNGGAMIAQNHLIGGSVNVALTNIESGQSLSDLGLNSNPFQ
jgi:hypothetical protein